ncbi:MAG: DNA packaging protein, partial [archaeon]|nr:DNA packaging protein [archaeon]
MAAPERNNFWTKRATHGRDKIFQTPEMFWECSCEYFQHVDENPYLEQNWVGKDGNEVLKNIIKPYTLQGLA